MSASTGAASFAIRGEFADFPGTAEGHIFKAGKLPESGMNTTNSNGGAEATNSITTVCTVSVVEDTDNAIDLDEDESGRPTPKANNTVVSLLMTRS